MKKITIVTVTYNCSKILNETIESCINQDYDNLEYIIIDGASTDGTLDIIKRYSEKINFILSEPDKGIYDAMNKGIEHATGEWIFFLNAGDKFFSDKTLSNIFQDIDYDCDAILGNYYSISNNGLTLHKVDRPFYSDNPYYLSMGFNHQCIFIKTKWAKDLKFDLSFKCCADYNMIFQIYKHGAKFEYKEMPITIIEGRYGFSQKHINIQRYEEARVLGKENDLFFKIYDLYKRLRALIKVLLNIK